jgi:hypothetical protein
MPDILPADATIASLVHELNEPKKYIEGVFAHMWECRREFGSVLVRVGITGTGKAPHYQIEYASKRGETAIYGIYRGLGHKLFDELGSRGIGDISLSDDPNEIIEIASERERREAPQRPDHFVQKQSWSNQAMSFEEMGSLLTELRKRRR